MTNTVADTQVAARAVGAVKTFGSGDAAVHALAGVTVDFPAHEFTAIMGPSGSGKSTLMQCVAGLDRLTSGEVFIGDTSLGTLDKTVNLGDRLRIRPSQHSAGQQQRVAEARALVPRPDNAVADEPTGALDSSTGTEILSFMRTAVDESGQTIVMVTHDPHAASYANRVFFLADGQVIDEMLAPTTDRVLDRMKQFEA